METALDSGEGRLEGSVIRLSGRVFGIELFVEEVVTQRREPTHKEWRTINNPRLLIIGNYRMGFDLADNSGKVQVRIYIDYELPKLHLLKPVVRFLAKAYARWCIEQMASGARKYFEPPGSPLQRRAGQSPDSQLLNRRMT